MNKMQRILAKTHLAVSLVPWAVLAHFTLYGFSLRRALGHWPVFLENPPDGFPIFLVQLSDSAVNALLFSVPLWFCLLGVRLIGNGASWRTNWRATSVFVLGWFVCLGLCAVYPGQTIYWLFD